MRTSQRDLTACRHCQHYIPEGRRGEHCQRLGALMQGDWKACPLMIPAFATSWPLLPKVNLYPGPQVLASKDQVPV